MATKIKVIRVRKSGIKLSDVKKLPMMMDLNSKFSWKREVDVMATFKKTGWKAPSSYRRDYHFMDNRKEKGVEW